MKFIPYRQFFFWTIFLVLMAAIFLVGCFGSLGKNHADKNLTQSSHLRQISRLDNS